MNLSGQNNSNTFFESFLNGAFPWSRTTAVWTFSSDIGLIGIFPKSSQRRGTRGCRNLGLRDLDSRNERIRIIAFQNIQNFSNRPGKNIFAGRWKFMENRKNPKFSSLTELFDAYAGSQQKFMFKSYSDRYKKCQVKVQRFIYRLRFILCAIYLI